MLEIVAFFFLRETYIPTLLKWKLARLKRNDRNNKRYTVLDLAKTSPEGHILSDLASATARPGTQLSNILVNGKFLLNVASNVPRS